MQKVENSIVLTRDNFYLIEQLAEKLAGSLFIYDSYFSGLNVAMEQFYEWTFLRIKAKQAIITYDLNDQNIDIYWHFEKEVFDLIQHEFSIEHDKACDIISRVVERISFLDQMNTILFHFEMVNNFEKIYASRVAVLADYFQKNRISDKVQHDTF